MYEEHLKTCEYCQKGSQTQTRIHKPTIFVKSASSYGKRKRLGELAAIIKGISYAGLDTSLLDRTPSLAKGASEVARKPGPIEKEVKLKELGKIIRGPRLT